MHFCADEARAIVATIHDPKLLLVYVRQWFHQVLAWVRTKCRRCPKHCP